MQGSRRCGLSAGSHIGPSAGGEHEHRAACPRVCGPVPLIVSNGFALSLGAEREEGRWVVGASQI